MGFERLLKQLDKIAPEVKDKIVIQRGCSQYIPKNCESFDFVKSLDPYYKKARIVILHGGSSIWEFAYKYKKPLIIIPRLKKYNEHYNDHQAEFAEFFSKNTGIKAIYNMEELTADLLNNYKKVALIDKSNFARLQNYLKKVISEIMKN